MDKKVQIPIMSVRAAMQPSSFNEADSSVEIVWSTGSQVRRYDWMEGPYIEELSMNPSDVNLERLNLGAPLLANHHARIDSVVGVVERAWIENGKGHAKVRFSDREDVKPIIGDVKSGILRNISVGYEVHEYEVTKPTDGTLPTYRAVSWSPLEVSLVAVPADAQAQVRSSEELHPVLITYRNEAMADPENQVPEEVEVIPATENVVETPNVEEIRNAVIKAERARIAGIRETVRMAKLEDSVADKLIESGKSLDEAKADVLRAWSTKVDATATTSHISMGETGSEKALRGAEEALLARAGIIKHADIAGNEFRGMRLSDMARISLERAGENTRGMSYDGMATVALRQGQTTSDFPVLLENTMHKIILNAYGTAPDTWRQICRVGSVSDFRAWKRLRTGTLANLSAVSEAGELTNMPISDATAESVQASRYGNIISITPEVIVNDDFDWIASQSAALGRAAARTVEAAVYTKLLANPTMSDGNALLSAAHGNIQTSGAAISVATVDAGRVAMAQQMDISSNDYLNIRPSILLCPVSMGGLARVTAGAQYDPDAAARLLVPNKIAGLISTIVDTPRLTTGWYLLASPTDAPVLEVVFLDGNESPRIMQEESFRTKGINWSVELPFGVGVIDYKGIYWNDGA